MLHQKSVEQILSSFKYKIKKNLVRVPQQDREDLEQEIKVKIIEKLNEIEFEETKGFWEFVTEDDMAQKTHDTS